MKKILTLGVFVLVGALPACAQQIKTKPVTTTIGVPALQISTMALPDGVVASAYKAQLAATGGVPPYVWSIAHGSLPPGLALDAASGTISGAPTMAGTYDFTVQVADHTPTGVKVISTLESPHPISLAIGPRSESGRGDTSR
jgi:hypothetical protein